MSNFFSNLVEQLKDEDTKILADGGASAEFSGCIDTGSYALNALLSGSIYGGVPNNKVTAFAGESATGKTFFVLGVVKQFLDDNPKGGVIYFDTEAAVTKQMMESKGIDPKRVVISEPDTIQKFRHTALKIIDTYTAQKESDRQPMMMVLDSMGQLSSTKEMEDTSEGKETKDMTKSQILKATFRVLNLKLAKIGVPLLVTNHVYDVVGAYIPTKEMSGGCLVAGTKIITKYGLRNIENVSIDDEVMTKEGVWRQVLDTHFFNDKDILEIEFEDGTKVKCTKEHKFLVNGVWIEAKDLMTNDSVDMV
jgi:RecA/RadA recombinase